MNTEKINAYKQVVDSLKEVNSFRTFQNIGTPERADLDTMAISLEALSWEIISDDITNVLNSLTSKVEEINTLNIKIIKSYTRLKTLSEKISKVAEMVSVLVEITSKAISVGLL
jgi:hypothetical protein